MHQPEEEGTYTHPQHSHLPHGFKVRYSSYIKPAELGKLLEPVTQEHDELLFITVHQILELWLQQLLTELGVIRDRLLAVCSSSSFHSTEDMDEHLHNILHLIKRSDKILRYSAGAFDVMETIEPGDFLEFRDDISGGSGFQSVRFRQLELLFGLNDDDRPVTSNASSKRTTVWNKFFETCTEEERTRITQQQEQPSLRDALQKWLASLEIPQLDRFVAYFLDVRRELSSAHHQRAASYGVVIPPEQIAQQLEDLNNFFYPPTKETADSIGRARRTGLFLLTFRKHARWITHGAILRDLLDLEQAFVLFRQRHVRMVERMIGRRIGTAGTSGVDYLEATTHCRVFKDLIRLRSEVLSLKQLQHAARDQSKGKVQLLNSHGVFCH